MVTVAINSVTNPINASNVTGTAISGVATAGASISVVASDGTSSLAPFTTTANSDGAWSISGINVVTLGDGTLTFSVTATGTGGGTAHSSATSTKDTVAPTVSIVSVTDPVNSGNATDTTISGTGTANQTITVTVTDGTTTTSPKTATTDANGNWTLSGIDVSTLASGTITYKATVSDAAGNTGTDTHTATKDTEAPTVTISSTTDPINAANQTAVSISGTGEAGATISLVITDSTTGQVSPDSVVVGQGGTWSITGIDVSSLADGTINFSVTATDAASNTTQASSTATKDTETLVVITDVTDPINPQNETSTSVSGAGEDAAMVSVVASDGTNSTDPMTGTVAQDGTWSITGIDVSGLADGTITYTATVTDAAGNTDSDQVSALKDTVAPSLTVDEVTDPVGIGNQKHVSASGTVEVGATVSVVVSDGTNMTEAVEADVDSEGNWSASEIDATALVDGTLTFIVTATDGGNNVTTDNSVTATKVTLSVDEVTDTITQQNQSSFAISGIGQVGATVSIVASDGATDTDPAQATIDENGNWTVSVDVSDLADGTVTFTITGSDNGDSVVRMATADKDTVANAAISSVTNPINAAGADDTTISGTGTAGGGISVVVTDGDTTTDPVTGTVGEDGSWSISGIDVSGLADGMITYIVTATDGLGNQTDYQTMSLKDTVAPEFGISSVTDPIGIGDLTSTSISGTGEANDTITVNVSDGTTTTSDYQTTADSEGNWSITGIDVSNLVDGELTFDVKATDAVGNEASHQVTSTKTTLVVTDPTAEITQANQNEYLLSGTGQAGAAITVVASDGTNQTDPLEATIDEGGNWSVFLGLSSLDDGTITFTVTASADGASIDQTATADKDTVADAAILQVTNPINIGNADDTMISGTGEVGGSVLVTATDGMSTTDTASGTIQEDGTWSVSGIDVSGLADGSITYTVTVTDSLGNQTAYLASSMKDTIAPTLAIDSVTDPVGINDLAMTMINGTGEEGDTITVVVSDGTNSTSPYQTTVDSERNWSITDIDVNSLVDGTITFAVTAQDAAGNETSGQTTATKFTVHIDEVTDPINADNQTAVQIGGTGNPAAAISVIATDGTNQTDPVEVQVDGNGDWSLSIDVSSLADGQIMFNLTATAGTGSAQTTISAAKDTVASVSADTVTNPINEGNVDSTEVTGTGDPGSMISIVATDGIHSAEAATGTVQEDGTWSVTSINVSVLDDGMITYTITLQDPAGNTASTAIDSQKDTVVVLSVDQPADIDIASAASYSIGGTGEVGATVSVVASDGTHTTSEASTVIGESGTWTISGIDTTGLDDGEIIFYVSGADAVGNELDVPPLSAIKTTVAVTHVDDPITSNAAFVSISGTGQVGATVFVEATDGTTTSDTYMATIDGSGEWAITGLDTHLLSDGTITFQVTAEDDNDNTVMVTTTALKDTTVDFSINLWTDPVTADNQSAAAISGDGEAGGSVSVTVTDGVTTTDPATADIQENGTWAVTGLDLSGLQDGTITYQITITDPVGNVVNTTRTALKDTVSEFSINLWTDSVTSDNQLAAAISGTGEAGGSVLVSVTDGTTTTDPVTVDVQGDGSWSITGIDVSSLDDGMITYQITVTDPLGNAASTTEDALKDTVAELAVLSATGPVNSENQASAAISGSGEAGNDVAVSITDGNTTLGPMTATVQGDGTWELSGLDLSGLADGTIMYQVSMTDAVGNTASTTVDATKDTETSVSIVTFADPVTQANQFTVEVSGNCEPGATVAVNATDGIVSTVAVLADVVDDSWSATGLDLSVLADGTITYTVTVTDAAGNTATATQDAIKDTVAELAVTDYTDPIDSNHETDVSISGTGEVGATGSVTVTDGTLTTIALAIIVDAVGNWSATGIDVTALAGGTVTFNVNITDPVGNTASTQVQAEKATMAEPLVAAADDTDDSGALDEALADSDEWLPYLD